LKHFLQGNLLTNHFRSLDAAIFQYDLRFSAAKNNSIMHAAAAPSNLDVVTTMRSTEIELRNAIELRAMASEIAAPKPDLDAKATKIRF